MNLTKKRFMTCITVAIAALSTAVVLTGCSQLNINTNTEVKADLTPQLSAGTTITDGVLTVGVNASNSPYGGTNQNNETVGLDVDIAAALASELGMKLQIVDVNSNGKSSLGSKQVDVALGVTKSGNNSLIAYSNAYINDGSSLFTLESNLEGAAAAAKKLNTEKDKILVQGNTATALEVQESLGVDSITAYGTMREAFEALEKGEGTFLAADAVIGDYMATSFSDIKHVGFMSSETVTPIYAVTLAENAELTQGVKNAFEKISGNGVLRVIVEKWLGAQGEQLMPGNVDIAKISDMFGKKSK